MGIENMQKFFPYKKYIMKVLRLPKKKVTRNMLISSPLHIYICVCVCVCVCLTQGKNVNAFEPQSTLEQLIHT